MMKLDFNKGNGCVPAIVQDQNTMQVLMLGFMNQEAYQKTLESKLVTFYSRTKNRLWTKGESSGNFLHVKQMFMDCDNDTLLIMVEPDGPTCHTGAISCFGTQPELGFLYQLAAIIQQRIDQKVEDSYTFQLFSKGINKVAQKLGEEAVELVIESKDHNVELFKNEAADLLYHFLILLKAKSVSLNEVEKILKARMK